MLRAISFGVFCRSAPSTRAIIRSRNVSPGLRRDPHDDLVGQHRVPPVTAERSPPDSRITGADSPVIADSSTVAMPSIDVAVAGDHLAGGDDTLVADARAALLGTSSTVPSASAAVRRRLGPGLAQRGRLGLAAPFGHRLGEVGEQHGEPQEGGDEAAEHVLRRRSRRRGRGGTGSSSARCRRATTNITGLRAWTARVQLADAVDERAAATMRRVEQRPRAAAGAGRGRCCRPGGSAVRHASCAPTGDSCSTMGPERQGGEEGQAGDDDDDADDEAGEQRRVGRERARGAGTVCLRASEPAIARTGMMRKNRPTAWRGRASCRTTASPSSGRRTPSRCCWPPT